MNSYYTYSIYGYIVKCNVKISCLDQITINNECLHDLTISITTVDQNYFRNYDTYNTYYKKYNNYIYLSISDFIEYHIYPENNFIKIYSISENHFISTIFNLPFTLFLSAKGHLLLHTSCLVNNNEILAFSGRKGAGKSTLTSLLSNKLKFFTDDTLSCKYIDNNIILDSGLQQIKVNRDTLKLLYGNDSIFEKLPQNIQGKAYINIENTYKLIENNNLKLTKIFIINRGNYKDFSLYKINNKLQKQILLHSTVVGVEVLGYEFQNEIFTNQCFKYLLNHISLYKLNVPNNLDYVKKNISTLINIINEDNYKKVD